MSSKLQMKIDGKTFDFEKGQTVLDVARKAGIYIPTLCYIEGLTPYGGCRLCLIKVLGDRKPFQTACSTPATQGMEVITSDNELQEMRTEIFQMLLSEHPNGCLICAHKDTCEKIKDSRDKTGRVFGCFTCSKKDRCEIRKIADYLGIKDLNYEFEYKNLPLEREDPFFERDYNLCILCGRCVRVCNELRGYNAINFTYRGHSTKVSTGFNLPHLNTDCQFCGSCVDICPTGALTPKNSKWNILEKEKQSLCNYCSICCSFDYFSYHDELVESIPRSDTFNKGQGCILGRFCTVDFVNSKNRILDPHIKKDICGLVPVNKWEEVFTYIKDGLSKYKPDEVAVLASSDLTNESALLLKLFAERVLKTINIATITNNSGISTKFSKILESERSLEKIKSSKTIILINANIEKTHRLLYSYIIEARNKGAHIVSISNIKDPLPNIMAKVIDDEIYAPIEEIPKKITEFIKDRPISIILGQLFSGNILNTILSLNSNIILLRQGGNPEGVFSIIPRSEESILQGIEQGKIKALYTTERINVDYANKLEFLIVQDIFPSDSSRLANVVLPTTTFTETNGSIYDIEGKLVKLYSSSKVKGKIKQDKEIISELANWMGSPISEALENKFNERLTFKEQTNEIIQDNQDIAIGESWLNIKETYRGELISQQVKELEKLSLFKKIGSITSDKQTVSVEPENKRFKVLESFEIVPNMFKMVIHEPLLSKKAKPGNFILVMKTEKSERIPITLSDWDPEKGTITIFFQERGYSTKELGETKEGDFLYSVVGPLGNEIKIQKWGTILLAGGCYGQGAIYPVAKAAKSIGNKVIVLLEARSKYQLYLQKEYEELVDKLYFVTADGSQGIKGTACGKSVTGIQKIIKEDHVDWAYIVGCKVMMAESTKELQQAKIPTIVSLNTIMLDGTGMCGACRLTTIVDGKPRTKFACVDGPTFDAYTIDWDELIKRSTQLDFQESEVYRTHVCKALEKYCKENSEEI